MEIAFHYVKQGRIHMRKLVFLLLAIPFAAVADPILVVDSGGNLLGANDVNVDGALYDVRFTDGPCTELFMGCDEASDFTFNTSAGAESASQALLDQVFVDGALGAFDSRPILTAGCDSAGDCLIYTPYAPRIPGFDLDVWYAVNDANELFDGKFPVPLAAITSAGVNEAWAVWTPVAIAVPEPGTLALLSIGLFGMGLARRRKVQTDQS